MSDRQLRGFNVADLRQTTAVRNGKWAGSGVLAVLRRRAPLASRMKRRITWFGLPRSWPFPSSLVKALTQEVGKSARSYIRKIQAWLRSTKLPPRQRALALYTNLKDRAWLYAEKLDIDLLGSNEGMANYLEWVQTRFMDAKISKVSVMMSDLFRRCKRRTDQSVRDFNVEFERLVLRLHEVRCELPPLVKAWLYLDKLRLPKSEELALLASVGNEYDVRRLQQAALIQDRALRRPAAGFDNGWKRPSSSTTTSTGSGRWSARSVHMTTPGGQRFIGTWCIAG